MDSLAVWRQGFRKEAGGKNSACFFYDWIDAAVYSASLLIVFPTFRGS